eukprot:scaffold18824_cov77-Cyclotella_meneghiniana.AAC.8
MHADRQDSGQFSRRGMDSGQFSRRGMGVERTKMEKSKCKIMGVRGGKMIRKVLSKIGVRLAVLPAIGDGVMGDGDEIAGGGGKLENCQFGCQNTISCCPAGQIFVNLKLAGQVKGEGEGCRTGKTDMRKVSDTLLEDLNELF